VTGPSGLWSARPLATVLVNPSTAAVRPPSIRRPIAWSLGSLLVVMSSGFEMRPASSRWRSSAWLGARDHQVALFGIGPVLARSVGIRLKEASTNRHEERCKKSGCSNVIDAVTASEKQRSREAEKQWDDDLEGSVMGMQPKPADPRGVLAGSGR